VRSFLAEGGSVGRHDSFLCPPTRHSGCLNFKEKNPAIRGGVLSGTVMGDDRVSQR